MRVLQGLLYKFSSFYHRDLRASKDAKTGSLGMATTGMQILGPFWLAVDTASLCSTAVLHRELLYILSLGLKVVHLL